MGKAQRRIAELEARVALLEGAMQTVLDDAAEEVECEEPCSVFGDAAPIHSTEDDYQHFLSYSNRKDTDDLRQAYYAGANVAPPSVPRPPTVGDDYALFLRMSGFNDHPCLWRAFLAGRMTG